MKRYTLEVFFLFTGFHFLLTRVQIAFECKRETVLRQEFKLSLSKQIKRRFHLAVWLCIKNRSLLHLHPKFRPLEITATVTNYFLKFVTETLAKLVFSLGDYNSITLKK